MSIFDILDSSKKIYRREFDKALRKIPELSDKERAYVSDVFQDSLRNGLSKFELKKEIGRLRYKPDDPLDSFEVEKIKNKLMEYF
ncbi:MAG: hypothetical protein ISS88_01955 [Candidatus Portnoybacteria bacterium]|nr:hypothetical protein [Candidatus Portnoybacteria bacterium]